jgi:hypothetical protein
VMKETANATTNATAMAIVYCTQKPVVIRYPKRPVIP